MAQTDYSYAPAFAVGQITHSGTRDLRSRINKDTVVLPYGTGVVASGEDGCARPTGATNTFVGVVARIYQYEDAQDSALSQGYATNKDASILTKGCIAVAVEEAVSEGQPVFCRFGASGGNTVLGRFRNDSDSDTCMQVPNARWQKGTTGAGIAVLELNLPSTAPLPV